MPCPLPKLSALLLALALLAGAMSAQASEPPPLRALHLVCGVGQPTSEVSPGIHVSAGLPQRRALGEALAAHLGKPTDAALLGTLADGVVAHLQRQGWPVAVVSLVENDARQPPGRVTLEVTQGQLAAIAVVGGSQRRQARVAKALASLTGQPLTTAGVQQRLDWLGRNPWLQAQPSFSPTADFTAADLLLVLPEASPFHASLGYENNGIAPLGQDRYSAALEWQNALGLGHSLSLLGSMAESPETFWMLAADWRAPLPWRHELQLSGYYAESFSSSAGDGSPLGLDIGGLSWMAAARYVVPWRLSQSWRAEFSSGFELKQFDTDLTFGGMATLNSALGVGQAVVGSRFIRETASDTLRLSLEAAHGHDGWAPEQTDAAYRLLTPGASATFTLLRGEAAHLHGWAGDWQTFLRFGGQWSDGPLLPSEEAALASLNVVRGYPERSVRGSRAAWASLELRAPQLDLQLSEQQRLGLRPFAFLDAGWSFPIACGCPGRADDADDHDQPSPSDNIAAVGFGLRGQLTSRLLCHAEIAWPLIDRDEPRLHLGLQLRF